MQGDVENLKKLVAPYFSRLEIDEDRTGNRVHLVAVNSQSIHQLSLDRLAEILFPIENRVLETDPSRNLVFDFPGGDGLAVSINANRLIRAEAVLSENDGDPGFYVAPVRAACATFQQCDDLLPCCGKIPVVACENDAGETVVWANFR